MSIKGAEGASSTTGNSAAGGQEQVWVAVGPIDVPADSVRALVFAMCTFSTAGGETTTTLRIRRGTAVTDPLVSAAAALTIAATISASGTVSVVDTLTQAATVAYCLTGNPAGGGATNVQSTIVVLFI